MPSRFALIWLVLEQLAFFRLAPGIADHRRPAAGDGDRAVTAELQATEVAELEQVPDMQAVSGRVETYVGRSGARVQPAQQVRIRDLVDEPAGIRGLLRVFP